MTKKYVILEHIYDEFSDELETRIHKNCFFDDKEDAERIAAELDDEYTYPDEYNEVEELSTYHEEDKPYMEGAD